MTDPVFQRLHVLALSASLAVVCIFVSFPQLDLAISGFFYGGDGQFWLRAIWPFVLINDTLKTVLTTALVLLSIMAISARLAGFHAASGGGNWRFVTLTFLLGPGLIVNGILKPGVGRPRPAHLVEFGGERVFTPMLGISDQCSRNCSFSSGEVALTATFAFVVLVLIWPRLGRRGKPLAALAGAGLIGLSSLLRIGLGRHFMSDALASIALVALVTLFAYRLCDVGTSRKLLGMAAIRQDVSAMTRGTAAAVQSRARRLATLFRLPWTPRLGKAPGR